MSPAVSFLSIVVSWTDLIYGKDRNEFFNAVTEAWKERARIEQLAGRFSKLLEQRQHALESQVQKFVDRCCADPRFARNDEFRSMSKPLRQSVFEKTVTGAGLIMRSQLSMSQRAEVSRLIVDWRDPRGTARWETPERSEVAFTIRDAIEFTAQEIAGMDDPLAALVADKLTEEFRQGTMELTSLVKVSQVGTLSSYDWHSSTVALAPLDSDQGRQSPMPANVDNPLRVWLQDERELFATEIGNLLGHQSASGAFEDAMKLVDETKSRINSQLVAEVEQFVKMCVEYSGEDRKVVAKEIALTAFQALASQLVIPQHSQEKVARIAGVVAVVDRITPITSTKEFAMVH